jgi:hypothetical protein
MNILINILYNKIDENNVFKFNFNLIYNIYTKILIKFE